MRASSGDAVYAPAMRRVVRRERYVERENTLPLRYMLRYAGVTVLCAICEERSRASVMLPAR